jgi:hypothetical protein
VNRLHDAFVAAGVTPAQVESTALESRFTFQDAVTDLSITNVITAYSYSAPSAPVDVRVAWNSYKTAVNNASTVAQIKSALTSELGIVLKELLKSRDAGLS